MSPLGIPLRADCATVMVLAADLLQGIAVSAALDRHGIAHQMIVFTEAAALDQHFNNGHNVRVDAVFVDLAGRALPRLPKSVARIAYNVGAAPLQRLQDAVLAGATLIDGNLLADEAAALAASALLDRWFENARLDMSANS
jgi:hypothetical protein